MLKKSYKYIVIALVLLVSVLGISYAFFEYYGTTKNSSLIFGNIYLKFTDGASSLSLTNVFPETKEEARSRTDNLLTFTLSGLNTTTNKDIWYEIILTEGDAISGKTRFNTEDLVFDLVEIDENGNETTLIDAGSFDDLNSKRIWVNTVLRNVTTEINRTYKLRMWLSEDVTVSDTNPNATYKASEFKNKYASVKVAVFGNFVEKKMPVKLAKQIEDTLTLTDASTDIDGTRYVTGSNDISNYVWYSGKLWRIVAINGDGTIKLVTQGNMTTIAWDINGSTDYSTSQVRRWLNDEFLPTLYDVDNLLVDATWDYTTYENFPIEKLETTSSLIEKVGLLNVYDFMMIGGTINSSGIYIKNGYYWWTMSPKSDSTNVWTVHVDGYGYGVTSSANFGIRPAINLISNIQILDGDGSKSNPYVIGGDKVIGTKEELLSNRISGEYINFNDVLYRIVETKEIEGQLLTKITMADYSINQNTLTTSLAFGASDDEITYSPSYGIGLYLEEWYQADSTSETYPTTYIKDNYKRMIATGGENGDGIVWYTGPTSGIGYDYTLSKTGTLVSATIGLGYYGEMFSSQFGNESASSKSIWLITKKTNSRVWLVSNGGTADDYTPTSTRGIRPSMYLKSDVKIVSGSGMPHDPYEITMQLY